MITLPRMICSARQIETEHGSATGICILCGQYTETGHPPKLLDSFTAYERIMGGDAICPYCNHMYTEQLYRKQSWVVSETEFRTLKRDNIKPLLLNPPEPPFTIYLTQTWKKQGWLNLINRSNGSRSYYVVGMDYDMIWVDASVLERYLRDIDRWLELGLIKSELSTGNIRNKMYGTVPIEDIIEIKNRVGNPLWNLAVYIQ